MSTLGVRLEGSPGGWGATASDENGLIVATGTTREEVVERFRGALKQHMEVARDLGREVPDVTELEIRELVPV